MSILIKGLDMPKESTKIYLTYYDDEGYIIKSQWCDSPIEIPTPHGRLIDADELKKNYPKDEDWEYPVNTNEVVCEDIDNALTIIEAEE